MSPAGFIHSASRWDGNSERTRTTHGGTCLAPSGREIGESEVSLAITGHAFSSVGQRYGEVTLETMREVVARIPLPGVADKEG